MGQPASNELMVIGQIQASMCAHEMAQDLFKAGAMDEIATRKMDALCLPPKSPFHPEDIRRI